MDNQSQSVQPISDDQELTKALAGISKTDDNLEFEETPVSIPTQNPDPDSDPQPATLPQLAVTPTIETKQEPIPGYNPPNSTTQESKTDDLEGIKKDALLELRPLVEKLELAPEEKFDIYLLLLRSTDDKTLIGPAHIAAQNIADETRRAQALLDIIKEINYFSAPAQPNA